jgi:hypothetical protein
VEVGGDSLPLIFTRLFRVHASEDGSFQRRGEAVLKVFALNRKNGGEDAAKQNGRPECNRGFWLYDKEEND